MCRYLSVLLITILLMACSEVERNPQPKTQSEMGYANKYLEVNGLTFRYIEKGQGELVLFVHGFPYFADAWYKMIEKVGLQYRAVAFDARGYAYSDKPENISDYHIEKLVSDLIGIANTLSPNKKVILVGHDWGAAIAWTTAQLYPERVSKLVLINGVATNVFLSVLQQSEAQRERSKYVDKLDSWLAKTMFSLRGAQLFWGGISHLHEKGHVDDQFKQSYLYAWEQDNAAQSAVKWYRANIPYFDKIKEQDFWPSKVADVSVSSLLIWSKNDPAFTSDVFDAIPGYFSDLSIKVIDTDSHSPFLDHADEVLVTLDAFLNN